MNRAAWVKRARSLAACISACPGYIAFIYEPPLGQAAFQGGSAKGGAGGIEPE